MLNQKTVIMIIDGLNWVSRILFVSLRQLSDVVSCLRSKLSY